MNERYREICENRDWIVTVCDDGPVELEKYSPAGEDFIVTVGAEDFVENVKRYAANFNTDEHIEMWVMARHNGVKGIPSIRELVHDAEAIGKMPQERATDLIQRAFQYAAGQETETAAPKVVQEARPVAQEPPKAPQPKGRPQSRVERIFGDFKASKAVEPKKPEPQREPEAYKGFLIIKCEQCGEIRAFCAKTPITRNACKCGYTTELHDLKPLHLKCKCGSIFNYRTNVTSDTFEWPCLNCGSPVDLELNRRGDIYVTISD